MTNESSATPVSQASETDITTVRITQEIPVMVVDNVHSTPL